MTHINGDTAKAAKPRSGEQPATVAPASGAQRPSLGRLTRSRTFPLLVSSFLVVILFIIGAKLLQGFASLASVDALLILSSFLGVAAIGETIAILLGGIDLAIPYVMGMSNVLAAQLTQDVAGEGATVVLRVYRDVPATVQADLADTVGAAKIAQVDLV